jgi:predicted nucleic acid-binding protein
MVVVSDASPLISLSALGQLDLLCQLYGEVVVLMAVWQELAQAPAFAPGLAQQPVADAQAAGWMRVVAATNRPLVTQLETALDPGEAEAIALAVELNPSLLLIDEREGRQSARSLNVSLTGTLGVLLRAKALGHLPAIKPLLTDLIQKYDFRLHPGLVNRVIIEAGELP